MAAGLWANGVGPVVNLILGVLDVAYSDAHGKSGATTTGEVAHILEDNYHVMETFYVSRQEKIANWLAESVAKAIETMVETGRHVAPTFEAEQKIETEFRTFLDRNEMSMLVKGLSEGESAAFNWNKTFSSAGNRGVNHRKKNPYSKKNKSRPVFIDTGLYQASFRAWIED